MQLVVKKSIIVFVQVVNVDTNYVSHFLRVPYRDYPEIFQAALLREESQIGRAHV